MTPAAASPGLVLAERYVLDAPLGRGGMADVYRGHDEFLERPVAVKVFRAGSGGSGSSLRQQSEMHVLSGLHHPNLVTLWDAGSDTDGALADRFYLVMELVDGPTLANRIAAGPLPASEVAELGAQLGEALAYIHERGIVHRDVKPANVLLAGSQVKLTDFGIARIVDGTRYTDDGTTIGTPDYLAPEQVSGGEVGVKADIYALGLILIESLTGQRCYSGTPVECAMVRLSRPPSLPSGLHGAWLDLLGAMTATDPAERPEAADVASELQAIARSGDSPTVLTRRRRRPVRRRRLLGRALAAAGLAVGLGTAGALIVTGHSGTSEAVANTAASSSGTVAPPNYPAVDGAVGTHLAALERDLNGLRSTSGARLRADALTIAQSFLVGNTSAASAALAQLRSDLASGQAGGDISAANAGVVERDLDALFGDLTALTARPPASSAPPPVVRTVTVTQQVQGPTRYVHVTQTAPAPQPSAAAPQTSTAPAPDPNASASVTPSASDDSSSAADVATSSASATDGPGQGHGKGKSSSSPGPHN